MLIGITWTGVPKADPSTATWECCGYNGIRTFTKITLRVGHQSLGSLCNSCSYNAATALTMEIEITSHRRHQFKYR